MSTKLPSDGAASVVVDGDDVFHDPAHFAGLVYDAVFVLGCALALEHFDGAFADADTVIRVDEEHGVGA